MAKENYVQQSLIFLQSSNPDEAPRLQNTHHKVSKVGVWYAILFVLLLAPHLLRLRSHQFSKALCLSPYVLVLEQNSVGQQRSRLN